jgi:hypothetical protein
MGMGIFCHIGIPTFSSAARSTGAMQYSKEAIGKEAELPFYFGLRIHRIPKVFRNSLQNPYKIAAFLQRPFSGNKF